MSVAMPPLPGRKPNADHRILICEDDRLIAMGWAAMLADGGYTVVGPAHSAEKALKMAYQHLPSLALVDIDLGGTIDGISVAAELAPLGVPVIFITADYKKAAVEGRKLAADILIKPVTHRTVLHLVASILQGKQGDNTARASGQARGQHS